MPVEHAEIRNIVFQEEQVRSDGGCMKNSNTRGNMSRTIKALERHMIPQSKAVSVQSRAPSLVADWQQRGPETLSGYALRKLRLSFAPLQSMTTVSAALSSTGHDTDDNRLGTHLRTLRLYV